MADVGVNDGRAKTSGVGLGFVADYVHCSADYALGEGYLDRWSVAEL
jgi:hypothetical protein